MTRLLQVFESDDVRCSANVLKMVPPIAHFATVSTSFALVLDTRLDTQVQVYNARCLWVASEVTLDCVPDCPDIADTDSEARTACGPAEPCVALHAMRGASSVCVVSLRVE